RCGPRGRPRGVGRRPDGCPLRSPPVRAVVGVRGVVVVVAVWRLVDTGTVSAGPDALGLAAVAGVLSGHGLRVGGGQVLVGGGAQGWPEPVVAAGLGVADDDLPGGDQGIDGVGVAYPVADPVVADVPGGHAVTEVGNGLAVAEGHRVDVVAERG